MSIAIESQPFVVKARQLEQELMYLGKNIEEYMASLGPANNRSNDGSIEDIDRIEHKNTSVPEPDAADNVINCGKS